ncbi:unnamed protein product [Orchesella dallaii]|uniref:Uncharacterized protein n=1 Tax=Orchesella dallaii TaxID=48710 RepID=A0ABP1Q3Y0_9HEXA
MTDNAERNFFLSLLHAQVTSYSLNMENKMKGNVQWIVWIGPHAIIIYFVHVVKKCKKEITNVTVIATFITSHQYVPDGSYGIRMNLNSSRINIKYK